MGAEPRILKPEEELAGLTLAMNKPPGSGVIAGLGLPEKSGPEAPEPQQLVQDQDNGLNSLVMGPQSPKPPEPSGPGGLA